MLTILFVEFRNFFTRLDFKQARQFSGAWSCALDNSPTATSAPSAPIVSLVSSLGTELEATTQQMTTTQKTRPTSSRSRPGSSVPRCRSLPRRRSGARQAPDRGCIPSPIDRPPQQLTEGDLSSLLLSLTTYSD